MHSTKFEDFQGYHDFWHINMNDLLRFDHLLRMICRTQRGKNSYDYSSNIVKEYKSEWAKGRDMLSKIVGFQKWGTLHHSPLQAHQSVAVGRLMPTRKANWPSPSSVFTESITQLQLIGSLSGGWAYLQPPCPFQKLGRSYAAEIPTLWSHGWSFFLAFWVTLLT